VAAVLLYAYLLVSLRPLLDAAGEPGEGALTGHLLGYPLVLASYAVAGLGRRLQIKDEGKEHSPTITRRPQPLLALFACALLTLIVVVYLLVADNPALVQHREAVNQATLVLAFLVLVFYRSIWNYFARGAERNEGGEAAREPEAKSAA
jgi:hypothetical protein